MAKSIIKILGKNDEHYKIENDNLQKIELEQKDLSNKKSHSSILKDLRKQAIEKIGIDKHNQIYNFLKVAPDQKEKNNVNF